jgi:hypothetical protein
VAHPLRERGPRQLRHDRACPAAGHQGRGGSVSGAAPGGGSVWPEQHRWNIGVVKAAAMEHCCRCGPGRGGAAEVCGVAGVCGASQARGGEPGGAMMHPRSRAWWHPDPIDGARGPRTSDTRVRAKPARTGTVTGCGHACCGRDLPGSTMARPGRPAEDGAGFPGSTSASFGPGARGSTIARSGTSAFYASTVPPARQ